jgi:hypothetical protein
MASHRIVAELSPHTSLNTPQCAGLPPHTTSRGRVLRNSLTPVRATLHTPANRHAPTSPLRAATRAQNSGRETARSIAQVSASTQGMAEAEGAMVCVSWFGGETFEGRQGCRGFFQHQKE